MLKRNLQAKEELTEMQLEDEMFQTYKTLRFHCVRYLVRVSCDDT